MVGVSGGGGRRKISRGLGHGVGGGGARVMRGHWGSV